jgi:hypothetical protein
MELLCPHCLKRVTVSDDKSGQVLNCPLCNGVFAAPSLAPAPGRSAAPSPPPPAPAPPVVPPPAPVPNLEIAATFPVAISPAPPPPPPQSPAIQPPPRVEPPKPPPPPGEYTRKFAFRLRPDILVFVPPACLFLIFVLSFFNWHVIMPTTVGGELVSLNLWLLAFGTYSSGVFLAYLLFFVLGLMLSVACVLLEQRWVPAIPQLAPLMPWKSLLTLTVLAVTFVLFAYDYQQGVFSFPNPIVLAEKIAFRLHCIALVAAALEVWAQGQRARNRPLPRFTVKW